MKEHFDDGEKVRLKETGETVTIDQWSIVRVTKQIQRYTYSLKEKPGTFFYHREIEKL
ncbi:MULTISPECIES: hypothetical protein [Paenibacillus]|uniref:hypothetical protein n=1 Tax=Paenibacillus TaxID=44249 RepID=UPI0015C35130|nr:hypothetical protein [Paenibacillus odorifer]